MMVIRRFLAIAFLLLPMFFFLSDARAVPFSGMASPIPWSGYWWPFSNGGLATGFDYRGHPAPLEKYLLLTTGSASGQAVDWYLDRYYDPEAEAWWGLCPAFARAAVVETYAIFPSVHDNIVFRVGDKKGLLVLCHDDQAGVIYGSTLTPVDFHFWLLHYIGEQKKGFAADLDSGTEVWYFPVYGYEMTSTRYFRYEQVSVVIYYADDKVPPDYMGTRQRQKTYTYELYVDAEDNITGGRWTGDSVSDHPNNLSFPESTAPLNPYLDYAKIRDIARAGDDSLEMPGNAPARLLPGAYNLVLLNRDDYLIQGSPGDQAAMEITRQEGSSQAMDLEITDQSGASVWQQHLTYVDSPIRFYLTLENSPYTLSITQAGYETDPNIYSLTMDFQREYVRQAPYIPKNGPWSGFALTNGSALESAEVMLVTEDSNGRPIQTVFGPLVLGPDEKRLFQLSNLPIRLHEYADTASLKVISDQPVEMLNLFAPDAGPMAGFCNDAPTGSHLIIPDAYANELGDPSFMRGAVDNVSFVSADVLFSVYTAKGNLIRTIDQQIPSRGRLEIRPGSSPFNYVADGGWIDILAADPESSLTGYQYVSLISAKANTLDTLFALPVASGKLYVQHITLPNGPWRTRLILINPNKQVNPVTIHPSRRLKDTTADMAVTMAPFEKQVIDLSMDFGNAANRSILEISGAYPLAGYIAHAENNGDSAAYPLLTDDDFKTDLVMPHAAYGNGQWFTGVGVCNPNPYAVEVLAIPHNQDGQPMESIAEGLFLEPGAYEIFTVHQKFFKNAKEIAFLKFRSEEPEGSKIGGFYLIGNSVTAQNPKSAALVSGGNM
jgi:hypothetical protein